MVSQGGSLGRCALSFVMQLLVSPVLPAWGLAMIVLGARSAAGWWIAAGIGVLAIGAIFLAGSSLITLFFTRRSKISASHAPRLSSATDGLACIGHELPLFH